MKKRFLLLIVFILAGSTLYYYRNDLHNFVIKIEESVKSEGIFQAEEDSFENKLIQLPAGLERPLCAAMLHSPDHEIRLFANYALCYRESYEEAEWSAYCLSDFQLVKNADRSNDFRPDPEISTESAMLSDYRKSGFDRGHLTPAADMSFSQRL